MTLVAKNGSCASDEVHESVVRGSAFVTGVVTILRLLPLESAAIVQSYIG